MPAPAAADQGRRSWLRVQLQALAALLQAKAQLAMGTLGTNAARLAQRLWDAADRLRWGFTEQAPAPASADAAVLPAQLWHALGNVVALLDDGNRYCPIGAAAWERMHLTLWAVVTCCWTQTVGGGKRARRCALGGSLGCDHARSRCHRVRMRR